MPRLVLDAKRKMRETREENKDRCNVVFLPVLCQFECIRHCTLHNSAEFKGRKYTGFSRVIPEGSNIAINSCFILFITLPFSISFFPPLFRLDTWELRIDFFTLRFPS